METKPYNLQSPEQIAKDYGGNKQKIAEAMQMGVLDPTAGTMAGMFIDRMRSAAQQEAAPQQTVAQQTFAPPAPPQPPMGGPQGGPPQGGPPAPPGAGGMPPAPPAGLGATPEAAAMAPQMPPMGAPPPQGGPGMAEGGMVPPYASGSGISDLPLPDGMFDEPSNGGFNDGYAGGGMVAFAGAGPVKAKGVAALLANPVEEEEEEFVYTGKPGEIDETGAIVVDAPQKAPKLNTTYMAGTAFRAPEKLGGFRNDIFGNLDAFSEVAPRKTKRAEELEAILEKQRSPEERKKSRQEDMWLALGQIGAKMASTPGSLLQAASAGIGEALPGIAANAKERRGEERALTRELLAEERAGNKEVEARAGIALDMLKGYNSLEQAFQDRNFNNTLTRLGIDADIVKAKVMAGAGIQGALISAAASRDVAATGLTERRGAFFTSAFDEFKKNAATDPEYLRVVKAKGINAGQQYLYNAAEQATNRAFGGGSNTIRFDSKGNQI